MQKSRNIACPLLPPVEGELEITHTKVHREECGVGFYTACLELAQHLWKNELPAQAILQINRSFMARLPADHSITEKHPIAYRAIAWIIQHSESDGTFLGNPVRHFQHLASRMNFKQPQPELRVWRAWCCFHLAEALLPSDSYPRDHQQITKESLRIPSQAQCQEMLAVHSPHKHELEEIKKLLL